MISDKAVLKRLMKEEGIKVKEILNPNSKSDILVFIDDKGRRAWKFKTKKGRIYGK